MEQNDPYRALQQHLDKQAVGFPATSSGAELRILQQLFTADEARLALHLSFRFASTADIQHAAPEFSAEQVAAMLENMFQKGGIHWRKREGIDYWRVMPLIVGIYEAQVSRLTPEFQAAADQYMHSLAYGKSMLAAKPPQMRTVPVNRSIEAEHHVATYDQIRALVESSPGPYVFFPCICRLSNERHGKKCQVTARKDTCFAMGEMAAAFLRRAHGHEVTREEALAILQQNQDEGLVLQPENAERASFVCSCCGCCCGMLGMLKRLPKPARYWASNHYAAVATEACTRCGACVGHCQMEAVTLGLDSIAVIDRNRCIGCGLCVAVCPAKAIVLKSVEHPAAPPADTDALNEAILANRKGKLGEIGRAAKVLLGMKP